MLRVSFFYCIDTRDSLRTASGFTDLIHKTIVLILPQLSHSMRTKLIGGPIRDTWQIVMLGVQDPTASLREM